MKIFDSISFESTGQFNTLFLDYINGKNELVSFYNAKPELKNFERILAERNFDFQNQNTIVSSLLKQYENIETSEIVKNNIELLKSKNTFTVTTGHQLCLLTGPLYFITKIITTINLAKQLKKAYPTFDFVPVYWMASEDHDFEEINHIHIFNKKLTWESNQTGAVGHFSTVGLDNILDQIPDLPSDIRNCYLNSSNLSVATLKLVNFLFQNEGLVIVDANRKELKELLIPIFKKELLENIGFKSVSASNEKFHQLGYKAQVNPREINIFYLDNGLRERIVFEDEKYKVHNTTLSFSKDQILNLVESNPEKFSPNVILRPVYQELILPNIAYIGGPGELSYWLQLKQMFDDFKVPFPVLMPRNFTLVAKKNQLEKLKSCGFDTKDIFKEEIELKNKYLSNAHLNVPEVSPFEQSVIQNINELSKDIILFDKSLEGFMAAQKVELQKIAENIHKKLKKSAETKEAEGINSILNIKRKLFPEGNLQERHDNFLNFQINDASFVATLLNILDPFHFKFNIIEKE